MLGRARGSRRRQRAAAKAMALTSRPNRRISSGSNRGSTIRSTVKGKARAGRAHSVRNCCPLGRPMSMAGRPVRSSSSTTPYAYTSAFSVIIPLSMYSGAKYLPHHHEKTKNLQFWRSIRANSTFLLTRKSRSPAYPFHFP